MIDFNDISSQKSTSTNINQNSIESFLTAISKAGIPIPESIQVDGNLHRYGKDKACYYSLHSGKFYYGIFGDWRNGCDPIKFCSGKKSEMNRIDIDEHERILNENRKKLKVIKKAKNDKAQREVQKIWDEAQDVITHPYLIEKNVKAHDLKILNN